MAELLSDLRQALRFARRNPGFSAAAVLTLGLGIGATSAVFSVLNALTLEPLAYPDAGRVCLLRAWDEAKNQDSFSMPLAAFVALAPQAPSFERVAAYRYWSVGLSGEGVPERARGYRVTGETFALLGVKPLIGRFLTPEDAALAAPPVVVLSHGLWQRRFAADPGVIGRPLRLDGEPYTVVGVMPARFEFPVYNFKGELWTPLAVDAAAALADPEATGSVVALGRLRKGASPRAAEAEVRAAFLQHAAQSPETFRSLGVRVLPLQELGAREARPPLLALLRGTRILLYAATASAVVLAGLVAVGVPAARAARLDPAGAPRRVGRRSPRPAAGSAVQPRDARPGKLLSAHALRRGTHPALH